MALTIRLLGRPGIEDDARATSPVRGHKAWGLLAYLAAARAPFPGNGWQTCSSPTPTIRWERCAGTVAAAALPRRPGGGWRGPVRLTLPPGATVDTSVLTGGSWVEAVDMSGLGLRSSPGCPSTRAPPSSSGSRVSAGTCSPPVRRSSRMPLGHGSPKEMPRRPSRNATRLVELNPLDENAHVLLILAMRAAGAHAEAAEQARVCAELLRRELGVDAGSVLRARWTRHRWVPQAPRTGRRSSHGSRPGSRRSPLER